MRKKTIGTLCLLAALAACGGAKQSPEPVVADTLVVPVPTVADSALLHEECQEEEVLPHSVDELFDDFIFNFAQSRRMQLSRIAFPLPVTELDGRRHTIPKHAWKHEPLFFQQDFYTVFYNSAEQMELGKRTDHEAVDVEWLLPDLSKVRTYCFERQGGYWTLTQEVKLPLATHPLADFLAFYSHFSTDSLFQRASIARPLHFSTADPEDDMDTLEGTLDVDQWFAFEPQLPTPPFTNIRYGQTYDNPRRIVLLKCGVANGLMETFTFEKQADGNWRLTAFEN